MSIGVGLICWYRTDRIDSFVIGTGSIGNFGEHRYRHQYVLKSLYRYLYRPKTSVFGSILSRFNLESSVQMTLCLLCGVFCGLTVLHKIIYSRLNLDLSIGLLGARLFSAVQFPLFQWTQCVIPLHGTVRILIYVNTVFLMLNWHKLFWEIE